MAILTDTSDPLTVVLLVLLGLTAAAAVAVVVCAVGAVVTRLRRRPGIELDTPAATPVGTVTLEVVPAGASPTRMPAGAEAILNAITEVADDPRNVVVTHRDPTGEIRLHPQARPDATSYPRSA